VTLAECYSVNTSLSENEKELKCLKIAVLLSEFFDASFAALPTLKPIAASIKISSNSPS